MLHCVDVLVRIVYSRFTHIRWPATLRGLSSSAVVGFQCRVPSHCHHSIAFGHRSFPLHRQDSKYCSRSRVALTKADLAAKCSNSGCSRWVAVAGMSRLRVRVKPKLDPPPPPPIFFPSHCISSAILQPSCAWVTSLALRRYRVYVSLVMIKLPC